MIHGDSNQKVIIIKANFALRSKIGSGKIAPKAILACQQVMESNAYDFKTMAGDLLKAIHSVTQKLGSGRLTRDQALEDLRILVMQFKANAAAFHYPLLSEIAQQVFDFLENIKVLDEPVLEIIAAFHETSGKLLEKEIRGKSDTRAKKIPAEFKKACERYWQKNKAGNRT